MIVAIDVDGVIADLMQVVLAQYNGDYKDSLVKDDIRAWDVSLFVKSECGKKIFSYFEDPHIYDDVKPINESLLGITNIRQMGNRVIFATTSANGTHGAKLAWLSIFGYLSDRKDYIECADKSLIRADVLIDDGIHNLLVFPGERVIFTQPWNKSMSVSGSWRANNWEEVVEIIGAINKAPHRNG